MISSLLRAASIWRAISCSVLTLPVKLSGGTIDGPLSAGASSFAAAIPANGGSAGLCLSWSVIVC